MPKHADDLPDSPARLAIANIRERLGDDHPVLGRLAGGPGPAIKAANQDLQGFFLDDNLDKVDHLPPGVYMIASPDTGLIKIGYSKQPKKRMAQIAGMSPLPLRPVALFPSDSERLEQEMHEAWRHCRHHHEWFKLTDKMKEWLAGKVKLVISPEQQVADLYKIKSAQRNWKALNAHERDVLLEWILGCTDAGDRATARILRAFADELIKDAETC